MASVTVLFFVLTHSKCTGASVWCLLLYNLFKSKPEYISGIPVTDSPKKITVVLSLKITGPPHRLGEASQLYIAASTSATPSFVLPNPVPETAVPPTFSNPTAYFQSTPLETFLDLPSDPCGAMHQVCGSHVWWSENPQPLLTYLLTLFIYLINTPPSPLWQAQVDFLPTPMGTPKGDSPLCCLWRKEWWSAEEIVGLLRLRREKWWESRRLLEEEIPALSVPLCGRTSRQATLQEAIPMGTLSSKGLKKLYIVRHTG